jgi:hypothetical protein
VNQPEDLNLRLSPLQSSDPTPPIAGLEAASAQYEFECELTQALRPVAPPEGFVERTLARLDPPATANTRLLRMKIFYHQRLWAGGAVAATLLASAVFTEQIHTRHQRQQAELAQQQFEAALQITDQTLEQTRQQLQQAGVQLGN